MKQRIGIGSDDTLHGKQHAEHVGRLVLNFGFLEYLTYLWISVLRKDDVLIDVAVDMTLGQRISLVKKMAKNLVPVEASKAAIPLWDRVRKLSELRNAVCHNPYIYGWSSGKEEGEPDFVASAHVKNVLKNKGARVVSNQKEIAEGMKESGEIANSLHELILQHLDTLLEQRQKRKRSLHS